MHFGNAPAVLVRFSFTSVTSEENQTISSLEYAVNIPEIFVLVLQCPGRSSWEAAWG